MTVQIAVQASGLGKQYGPKWALESCTLEIPSGSVTALVGPNGAGKTTLLQLVVGLTAPSAGSVSVFGCAPRAEARLVLPRVGFVAQEHPLYGRLTVSEMLSVARRLNPSWDDELARERVRQLGLPPGRRSAASRAASRRRSRSPSRSPSVPSCSSSTSPSPRSTPSPGGSSCNR